jgi:drug/metabolite transporter (DMT)-like permease
MAEGTGTASAPRGQACVVLANLLFAIGYSFVAATSGALSVWQLLLVRGLLFALVLLPWAAGHRQIALGSNRTLLLASGILGTAMIGCLIAAVTVLPLSMATLLGKTTPLWELLVLWGLLALRPRPSELLLVPIALFGLVLLLHPEGRLSLATLGMLGLVLALASGLLNSLVLLVLSGLRSTDRPQTINLWYAAVMIVVSLPFAATQPWPADPRIWLFTVMFCLFSLAGQSLLAHSMHQVSPTFASVGTLFVPIFATLIDWAIFGQLLSGMELIGILLVLAAGALVARAEKDHMAGLAAAKYRWQRAG